VWADKFFIVFLIVLSVMQACSSVMKLLYDLFSMYCNHSTNMYDTQPPPSLCALLECRVTNSDALTQFVLVQFNSNGGTNITCDVLHFGPSLSYHQDASLQVIAAKLAGMADHCRAAAQSSTGVPAPSCVAGFLLCNVLCVVNAHQDQAARDLQTHILPFLKVRALTRENYRLPLDFAHSLCVLVCLSL